MPFSRLDPLSGWFSRRKAQTTASPAISQDTGTSEGGFASYLFVQSFQSGSIEPHASIPGTYTLTLEHGLGQTVYFSDRPDRAVGTTPTSAFLDGFGFSDDNPPNAALLVDDGSGSARIAVVELFHPGYETATHTATYAVSVLEDWDEVAVGDAGGSFSDLSGWPESFCTAHLFIDDCEDNSIYCVSAQQQVVASFPNQGFCWNYALCIPCEPYGHDQPDRCSVIAHWTDRCNAEFGTCGRRCTASFGSAWALCPS